MEFESRGNESVAAYFAARAAPELAMGDPFPLIVPMPCDVKESAFTNNRLNLTEAIRRDWELKNNNLKYREG